MTNATPMQPKKRNPLVWILAGCAVFVVIGGAVVSGSLWWGYHKAKSYVSEAGGNQTDSGNPKAVAELWSDVPRMDGMTPSQQVDMPVALKTIAR